MKSLIVDDDFVCRKILAGITSMHGSYELAVDGAEALAAVEDAIRHKVPFDVVFLDINMPGQGGLDVLAAIRRAEQRRDKSGTIKKTMVVMVTSDGDFTSINKAYHENCDGYLVKPVNAEKVKQLLQTLRLISLA